MQFIQKVNFKFEEVLFIILPFAIITGPLISEIVINLISIKFIYESYKTKDFKIFFNKIIYLLFIFYFVLVFSSFIAFYFKDFPINNFIKNFFYFRFILFGISIYWLIKNNHKILKIFFYSLLFAYIALCIGGMYEYFFKQMCGVYDELGFWVIKNKYFFCNENYLIGNSVRGDRLSSFFGDEMIFGSYLSRLLPLLIYLIFVQNNIINKNFISLSVILVATLMCIISGERISVFYCIIIFLLFAVFIYKKIFYKIIILLSFIILFLSTFLINPDIKKRIITQTFTQITQGTHADDAQPGLYFFSPQHSAHAYVAIKLFSDNKWLGVGPKNFRIACPKKYSSIQFGCTTHPHNTYLQLLSETGIVGFSIPFFILLLIIKYYIKNFLLILKFKNKDISLKKIILLSSFLITLFPFIPSGNFFTNHLNIIFYLPLGFYIYEFNKFSKK